MKSLMTALTLLAALSTPVLHADDWRTLAAHYEVPVEETDLVPYASYEIPDIRLRERGETLELKYELPTHLVGEGLDSITFEGPADALVSEFGIGHCEANQCTLNYNKKLSDLLTARLPQVEELLRRDFSNEELAARLEIAKRFAGDPIGVVVYKEEKINYLPLEE